MEKESIKFDNAAARGCLLMSAILLLGCGVWVLRGFGWGLLATGASIVFLVVIDAVAESYLAKPKSQAVRYAEKRLAELREKKEQP